MIKYVIFDMDGTLLDTEPLYERSWVETGEKWGLPGMQEMYIPLICGRTIESSKKVLKDYFGENFDSEGFIEDRMALYHELTKTNLRLKKGAREIIDFLKSCSIPMAIGTSTIPEITYTNLKRVGIFDCFDTIVTCATVKNSKPAPDIFLEAGKRLGVETADECIVCEDSYSGIFAAHAAGMKPILIPDLLKPTKETDAVTYATVESLLDVIEIIKNENKII